MHLQIDIIHLPDMHLAAVQSTGVQNIGAAYEKLMLWAVSNHLPMKDGKTVTVYHDSFRTTPPDQVKMHACLLVDQKIQHDGEIFPEILPAGKHIVGHFEISHEEFGKTWSQLFVWMNENGYRYRNTPPFEIYHNKYWDHPEKKSVVDFCIPVV